MDPHQLRRIRIRNNVDYDFAISFLEYDRKSTNRNYYKEPPNILIVSEPQEKMLKDILIDPNNISRLS